MPLIGIILFTTSLVGVFALFGLHVFLTERWKRKAGLK